MLEIFAPLLLNVAGLWFGRETEQSVSCRRLNGFVARQLTRYDLKPRAIGRLVA